MNSHNIIIAGDLFPAGKNVSLFEGGDALALFGDRILSLFHNADYSFVNLEGVLTSSNIPQVKTGPAIKAPEKCIHGIKALGVHAVMLANNHITDFGREGFSDTIRLLDDNGIQHVGAGENQDAITKYQSITIGKYNVCIYNVSELFYNQATTNSPGVNLYDEYLVCDDLKTLKQTHDYLIVIYHGGAEEFPYPTPLLQKRFHRMADCGADFITAQHTHCVGCYENYNGSYLLYGQGNFLFSRMRNNITKHGLITEIVFGEEAVSINQHLVNVSSDDLVRYDPSQDLSAFHTRSKDLCDMESILKKYQEFCYNKPIIKDRFLKSFRGSSDSPLFNLSRKLTKKCFGKDILEKYRKEQLMRIAKCMESERYAENMLACIRYIMEK